MKKASVVYHHITVEQICKQIVSKTLYVKLTPTEDPFACVVSPSHCSTKNTIPSIFTSYDNLAKRITLSNELTDGVL